MSTFITTPASGGTIVLAFGATSSGTAAGTVHLQPRTKVAAASATANRSIVPTKSSFTITNAKLFFDTGSSGTASNATFTLTKNGADTTATFSLPMNSAANTVTSYSGFSVTFTEGDYDGCKMVVPSGVSVAMQGIYVEFLTAT